MRTLRAVLALFGLAAGLPDAALAQAPHFVQQRGTLGSEPGQFNAWGRLKAAYRE